MHSSELPGKEDAWKTRAKKKRSRALLKYAIEYRYSEQKWARTVEAAARPNDPRFFNWESRMVSNGNNWIVKGRYLTERACNNAYEAYLKNNPNFRGHPYYEYRIINLKE